MDVYSEEEGPGALDRSPESWHIEPMVKEMSFKIFLLLALIGIFFSGVEWFV